MRGLLLRRIDCVGHEGPAELGKVEELPAALDRALPQPACMGPNQAETDPRRARWSASSMAASAFNRRRRAAEGRIEAERRGHQALTTAQNRRFRRHYLNRNAVRMR
jgi:hypothetical protein